MQIQAITPHLSFVGVKRQDKFNSTGDFQKLSYTKDSFEKQNSEISFTANKKENIKDNLGSSLSNIKMKGLPFLLGVVTSAAMVKMGEQASELLCDSDGYLVTEDGVFSDLVNIDLDEQILESKVLAFQLMRMITIMLIGKMVYLEILMAVQILI